MENYSEKMTNKIVCFDLYTSLTVPAVQGGAIETIITTLINENEKHGNLKFVIISRFNKNAKEIAKKYKNTKIVYIKDNVFLQKVHDKILYLSNKIFYKLTKREISARYFTYYKYKKLCIANKLKYDLIVVFGPDETYKKLKVEKNKIILYLHYKQKANELTEYITPNVIGVSNYIVNNYCSSAKNQVNGCVLLNRVDEDQFNKNITDTEKRELKSRLNINDDELVIIYTGRIHKEKGIEELVESIKSIESEKIKLLVCGGFGSDKVEKDEYYSRFINLIEKIKKIIYLGYIDNNELYKYYQISDIQVVPSIVDEAAGLVNIEGMLSGLPIITTDAGGIPEYVDEKCAFILKRDNKLSEEIGRAIIKLYYDRELLKSMRNASLERSRMFTKKELYDNFVGLVDYYG